MISGQKDVPEHQIQGSIRFPIVHTLYAGLPQAQYVPDEAGIMFDSGELTVHWRE